MTETVVELDNYRRRRGREPARSHDSNLVEFMVELLENGRYYSGPDREFLISIASDPRCRAVGVCLTAREQHSLPLDWCSDCDRLVWRAARIAQAALIINLCKSKQER
jgi:hypothetical protein